MCKLRMKSRQLYTAEHSFQVSITKPAFSGYRFSSTFPRPFSAGLSNNIEAAWKVASNVSSDATTVTATSGLKDASPSLHLVIPASEANANLCKTILSAFILNYPAPTLVNYGKNFTGDSWDKGAHTGKIRGIYDFLWNAKHVADRDLVLIVDGYDVWFQLPPEVLIKRYNSITRRANERLRKQYGLSTHNPMEDGKTGQISMYSQRVTYAADKLCWPNAAEDPACTAIPLSTLPKSTYGTNTDKDPHGFRNRPRYLNSGTVIGPASDLRAILERGTNKVEQDGRGDLGDQFIFSEIFGEQEYVREAIRHARQSTGGRWLSWLSNTLGLFEGSRNLAVNNMTFVPGQRYEFGLGLDYESQLFQTMTHSHGDIDFLQYNDSETLAHVQKQHHIPSPHPLFLPLDIQRSKLLVPTKPPAQTEGMSGDSKAYYLDHISTNISWSTIPLATNPHVPSVPAILHFNGDKSYLSSWWTKMWYQPDSRALLRTYMQSTRGPFAAHAAAVGADRSWNTRGGKGGVWTDTAQWLDWSEICKGYEEEVFGDGKGVWGQEDGVKKVYNSFGKLIEGEPDENDILQ